MAASSQYYSVSARVGVPSRHEVEVTIPLIGPAGPAGEGGGGAAILSLEVNSTNSASPDSINLTSSVEDGNLNAVVLFQANEDQSYGRISFPELANTAFGEVIIRRVPDNSGFASFLRVILTDQGQTAVYPTSGYDEFSSDDNFVFRWSGSRWVLEIQASEIATTNHAIYLPDHGGILPAWRQYSTGPSTPTSPGARGQLAFGYDDGQERLYICVANNTWRRVPISTWTPAP